jgi:hypothetical protein
MAKAHQDPNHHRHHLRRPRVLDGGLIYAHDSEAQTVTKNFEAAIPMVLFLAGSFIPQPFPSFIFPSRWF